MRGLFILQEQFMLVTKKLSDSWDDMETQSNIASGKESFKQNIKRFVYECNQKQQQLIQEKKRKHIALETFIEKAPILSEEMVELFFEKSNESLLSSEVISSMKKKLHGMRKRVNDMPNRKRFYILQTMNFFSSQISIGKLIPALLVLSGNDQKKMIWEFSKPTFTNINSNVEILVSTDAIFSRETIHLDRGSLYLFVSDVAKVLLRLFRKDFLDKFPDIRSPVELMLKIVVAAEKNPEKVYQNILDKPEELQDVVLDFVSTIQSHDALFDYSVKRDAYYKNFLYNLTSQGRFPGISPEDVSKILAGCLLLNSQRKPSDSLIESMLAAGKCLTPITEQAKRKFIDSLTPTTVHKLINQFMHHLQEISKTDLSHEMKEVQSLSVRNILKTVWQNVIEVVEKGVIATTEAFTQVYSQVKTTFKTFTDEEKKRAPKLPENNKPKREEVIIAKDSGCIQRMQEIYKMVETDVAAFRGGEEGASRKDFSYNSRIFKQDESTMLKFQTVFNNVFEAIQTNFRVKIITYKSQRKIKEYYVAYSFEDYIIAFGITHIKNPNSSLIQEQDLFPYTLLFQNSEDKEFGRVLGREMKEGDSSKNYNEVAMTGASSMIFYEALYHFVHLLPEKYWNTSETQTCIRFLVREMKALEKGDIAPRYCASLPDLGED